MKLAKYLVVIFILAISSYSVGWYYLMNHIAGQINEQYAGKKHLIKGLSDDDYYTIFTKASPAGFPFKFLLKISEWKEESKTAVIDYNRPIYVGYDLTSQKLVVDYKGEIISEYKPVGRKFGARFEVDKYFVTVDLPITSELIHTMKNMNDPFEIVNHFGKIKAGTTGVRIFDLNDNGKFYDKEYEQLNFTFEPAKQYISLDDFLQNIPGRYIADYAVKTNSVTEPSRRLPVSLLYGFFTYPSDFYAKGSLDVKTKAKTFETLAKDIDMKMNFKFTSPYVDMKSGKFEYQSLIDNKVPAFAMHSDANFRLKKGAFDELFRQYMMIKPNLMKSAPGKLLNREVEYIINNKKEFKFDELEDSNYEMNLKVQGTDKGKSRFVHLENMSIFSEQSGFRINAESTMQKADIMKGVSESMKAKGVLFIQRYSSVVEFCSGYIYRFGKFRSLSKEARDLYIKVNKKFLKMISDYPNSTSDDLSFEFEIDSNSYGKMKFGSAQLDEISGLYQNELFKNLVDQVGLEGDFEQRMKQLIPDLDLNSPILQKVIPKLKKMQTPDGVKPEETIKKEIEKILPKDNQELIEKIDPDKFKKKINKELLKNMSQ